jgi:Protein of unknown function DUF2617
MTDTLTRPRVADLVFRLYDRPVHPELYESVAERRVRILDVTLTVRLTATGHVLEWSRPDACLVELTAVAAQELPAGGKFSHPFQGTRRARCKLPGVRYEMSSHAEVLPAHIYSHVHDELAADGAKHGVLAHLRPRHRFGLAPLGLVRVEPVPDGLCVSTFHTFPDELAVVKTQSLIEPA